MAEKKSKLAEIKTRPTAASVDVFLNSVDGEQKRKDSFTLLEMMQQISGEQPKMWGGSIIGFGEKRYKSPTSGREVDWFLIGLSPRKANLTLYLTTTIKTHDEALGRLGKHKTGGGCLYLNKLADVDLHVLKEITKNALERNKKALGE